MSELQVSCFQSELGWFGIVGRDSTLYRICFGQAARDEVFQTLQAEFDDELVDADWHPELRSRLEQYAAGHAVNFEDIDLNLDWCTGFQQQVIERTRRVEYGETISYGALAAECGRPKAARAVGTVMSSNRYPIIVPCHRVLGSGGKLGGFSAPGGIDVKRQMLRIEDRSTEWFSERP